MAITELEYVLFRRLREQGALPMGADILELGEANWYGDVGIDILGQDVDRFAAEGERQDLRQRLDDIVRTKRPGMLFELASVYWKTFFQPSSMTAIDFHGTAQALRLNLNDPIDLGRQFDIVMNLGTIEHVFNVAQALRTVHDHAKPGGLMIHGMPFTGWVDHGFYSFHPTFYWDLASANDYEILFAIYTELKPTKLVRIRAREDVTRMAESGQMGPNALIYVVLRRPAEAKPFKVPIQGYYAGAISSESQEAWKTLR